MRRPLISFQNFSFTYSDQNEPTLEELNVTIYEGEKILVLGPSGSGKTTFLRLCYADLLPSGGQLVQVVDADAQFCDGCLESESVAHAN